MTSELRTSNMRGIVVEDVTITVWTGPASKHSLSFQAGTEIAIFVAGVRELDAVKAEQDDTTNTE